jgi:hypothetical protein
MEKKLFFFFPIRFSLSSLLPPAAAASFQHSRRPEWSSIHYRAHRALALFSEAHPVQLIDWFGFQFFYCLDLGFSALACSKMRFVQ